MCTLPSSTYIRADSMPARSVFLLKMKVNFIYIPKDQCYFGARSEPG